MIEPQTHFLNSFISGLAYTLPTFHVDWRIKIKEKPLGNLLFKKKKGDAIEKDHNFYRTATWSKSSLTIKDIKTNSIILT